MEAARYVVPFQRPSLRHHALDFGRCANRQFVAVTVQGYRFAHSTSSSYHSSTTLTAIVLPLLLFTRIRYFVDGFRILSAPLRMPPPTLVVGLLPPGRMRPFTSVTVPVAVTVGVCTTAPVVSS